MFATTVPIGATGSHHLWRSDRCGAAEMASSVLAMGQVGSPEVFRLIWQLVRKLSTGSLEVAAPTIEQKNDEISLPHGGNFGDRWAVADVVEPKNGSANRQGLSQVELRDNFSVPRRANNYVSADQHSRRLNRVFDNHLSIEVVE